MDKFLKEFDGHIFVDEGAYCSNDFKTFARKFKNYLKRTLPANFEIVDHYCGHYYLCGFVKNGNNYAYYSWTWNRYSPVRPSQSILVRTAKNERDFTGGFNQYTELENLPQAIVKITAENR